MMQLDLLEAIADVAPVGRVLRHVAYHKLGEHKGSRRVWLEGKRLRDVGFVHGVRYRATVTDGALVLTLSASGDRVVSGRQDRPVVDLLTRELGDVDRIQVRFLSGGEIRISVHPVDKAAGERLARLLARLERQEPVQVGSLCHGGGVTAEALVRGFGRSGVDARLAFGLEIDGGYLEQALAHNPLWLQGGLSVEANLDEVEADLLPTVDVLDAGLPCTAASRAGRAKKGTAFAEEDAKLAHLVYGFLRVVERTQPAVIVLENVVEYASTASAAIIRGQLGAWGYEVQEQRVEGQDYSLEARPRLVLVATTRGLPFDLSELAPVEPRPGVLGEVLDFTIAETDERWRTFDHLKAKRERDAEAGKSFKPQVVSVDSTSVPTLRRGYWKGGSTDPRLQHPSDPERSRLLSAAEHARVKGVPAALVDGLSNTRAHEILGQSVTAPAFVALGSLLGRALAGNSEAA